MICKQKEEHAGEESHTNSRRSGFTWLLRRNSWAVPRADSENGRVGCLPGWKTWACLWKDHHRSGREGNGMHDTARFLLEWLGHLHTTGEDWERDGGNWSPVQFFQSQKRQKGGQNVKKKKKVLKGIQREKKYHKCLRMNEIFWLPFVCPVFRDTKLEHVVLIKKKTSLKVCNLQKASLLLQAVLRIPPTN